MFEAGLFGGALGMRRTFILHANGAKLPTDLLGLTCVRYADALTPTELKTVNQKLRKAIEAEGRLARIEGDWWQYSLTVRTEDEPSAISLLRISRDRVHLGLALVGRLGPAVHRGLDALHGQVRALHDAQLDRGTPAGPPRERPLGEATLHTV